MNVSYNTGAFRRDDFELMCRVLNKIGLDCVELHLAHFIESNPYFTPQDALRVLNRYKLGISIVDGGWCDLANDKVASIPKQIELAKALGVKGIRLFLTPYRSDEIDEEGITKIHYHIGVLAENYPDIDLLFETHHGIGVELEHLEAIMIAAPDNVGIVFDPINLLANNVDPRVAMDVLSPFIKHVHLKGGTKNPDGVVQHCAFGEGSLFIEDLVEPLAEITDSFGIEYEGVGSPILGLLKSKENLEMIL